MMTLCRERATPVALIRVVPTPHERHWSGALPAMSETQLLRAWKRDPPRFVRDVFGVTPDPWQDEVLAAFPRNQRLAMKACKGPGKTAVLAWLAWNFLPTNEDAKIAATSVSADNLADNLWTEMAKWQAKSPLLAAQLRMDEDAHLQQRAGARPGG